MSIISKIAIAKRLPDLDMVEKKDWFPLVYKIPHPFVLPVYTFIECR